MRRSLLSRGLVLMTTTTGLIVGCSAGTPTEGDLPATKAGTPEDFKKLDKDLLQKKIASGEYKKPPAINIPKQ